jgi:tRNA-guanine family transglycosylase
MKIPLSQTALVHLLKAKELLALQLISIHNISFMNRLMSAIRTAIENDSLDAEKQKWVLETFKFMKPSSQNLLIPELEI